MKPWLVSLLAVATCAALPACPDPKSADYDFIVIGAGAGGGPLAARLAESGFSVLLVDAGHETVNLNTTVPTFSLRSLEDPQIELNYTLQEYPDGFAVQRNDQWYRFSLEICAMPLLREIMLLGIREQEGWEDQQIFKIHNAMINIIAGTRDDFDGLANTFQDPSWSRNNMQNYLRRIEHNLYLLPLLAPDHGFDGWLKTSGLPLDVFIRNPLFLDPQLVALVASIPLAGPPILDLNNIAGDGAVGVNFHSFTVDEHHMRSSVHERLQSVKQSSGKLNLSLDTLATKLLLCNSGKGVSAYGAQIAPGAALPVASNFAGKGTLNLRNVTARHEVIVSAGTFQSPQLLMLSGIGNEQHLRQFNIDPVVNLPGVGTNLQDHDEIAVIWRMKNNYTIFDGCLFLSDPDKDPCLRDWLQSNHENLYAFAGTLASVITRSSPSQPAPDILTYLTPGSFQGLFRGIAQQVADNHNGLTAVILKGHPSTRGTVQLTGSHPQDFLNIQKLHFQAPDGPADIAALREGIKRARQFVTSTPLALFVESEVSPGPNVTTDEEIDRYILEHVWGHHICCTNPIGADDDPNAVLDGDFRVRGVDHLRLVDASSWPNVPGFFPTTPIYMMSEKAADVIIAAAKARASAT